jgi:multiple sugar transport system ATP-binding protein
MNIFDAVAVKEGDAVCMTFGNYKIQLDPVKSKRIIDGGYIDKEVYMGIRPEDLHDEEVFLSSHPDSHVDADVELTEMLGAEIFLYVTIAGLLCTARVDPRSTAKPGDTIKMAIDTSRIHVFDKDTEAAITN